MKQYTQYTYAEVSEILCEGCKKHLESSYSGITRQWEHHCCGVIIPCLASEWRRKRLADAPDEVVPSTPTPSAEGDAPEVVLQKIQKGLDAWSQARASDRSRQRAHETDRL